VLRSPATQPVEVNTQMKLVEWVSAPMCLNLVHNTRVCAARVDTAADAQHKVTWGGAGWG